MTKKIFRIKFSLAASFFSVLMFSPVVQSYGKILPERVIPVSAPGCYDQAGAIYMLTNDIYSERSAIFLGKDITLDLNGYTITFAGGDYEHIPNYGFEEGTSSWDISKAPGAKVVNTAQIRTFIGDKILSLEKGDEVVSPYINLPVANRSYFAMCGITGRYYNDMGGDLKNDMKISIYVENEQGDEIECVNTYGDTTLVGCPVISRSARLGGGFVFAHLKNLPAGKYRIRVKAETDCLVDHIDIRPAMDVGIGIVGDTHPYGHYDHFYNIKHSAFYDYTENFKEGKPIDGIPKVEGKGTVTIKNGTIKNGTRGIASWGIQSTAEDVRIILDSITIINQGINAIAVDVPHATITNCTFKVDNPFIINRHGSQFYAVDLRGRQHSEVSYSEFYGGQGNLVIKGLESKVHHNYFVNRQTVTNHYSVMAMGDGSMIFENKFKPEIGSGLEIYSHKNIEIFNNEFIIKASPPSCEYADNYSTNAIRLADYGSDWGSPSGSYGNRIYNNKFHITGKKFKEYVDYIPIANAIFFSASAGNNYVFGNEIVIEHQDPDTDAEAFAFYIGNARGGQIYNNRITSNVPPIWVASRYGKASDTQLYNNIVVKTAGAPVFKPIRMGSFEQEICITENVEFRSNKFEGIEFGIDATSQRHNYTVFWTLDLDIKDTDVTIKITDKNGKVVVDRKPVNGKIRIELPEYSIDGNNKIYYSPYTVTVGKKKQNVVVLNKNSIVEL